MTYLHREIINGRVVIQQLPGKPPGKGGLTNGKPVVSNNQGNQKGRPPGNPPMSKGGMTDRAVSAGSGKSVYKSFDPSKYGDDLSKMDFMIGSPLANRTIGTEGKAETPDEEGSEDTAEQTTSVGGFVEYIVDNGEYYSTVRKVTSNTPGTKGKTDATAGTEGKTNTYIGGTEISSNQADTSVEGFLNLIRKNRQNTTGQDINPDTFVGTEEKTDTTRENFFIQRQKHEDKLNTIKKNHDVQNTINKMHLSTQAKENLASLGIDYDDLSGHEREVFEDIMNGVKVDLSDDINLSPEVKAAFLEIQSKVNNNEYEQYDFSDPDFDYDKIPDEYIENLEDSDDTDYPHDRVIYYEPV